MNKFLSFLSAAVIMLTLVACGGDDGPSDPGQGQNKVVNTNRNIPTSMTPKEITHLEIPKLASENSIVLVHHTSGAQDVSYSCEWDYKKKSNRWSCCAMTNKTIKGGAGRVGDFEEDPNLPTAMRFSDTNAMYTRSGYTRGHLIASADIQYSREANHTTFYYSNIQPQHYDFNAGQNYEGIWVRMESWVRKKAESLKDGDTLFVCKGGTIDKESQIMERVKGQLIVPKYFYMALLMKTGSEYKAIALWVEHQKKVDTSAVKDHAITVKELQNLTGIDFFCNLPDDIENRVEGKISPISWGL